MNNLINPRMNLSIKLSYFSNVSGKMSSYNLYMISKTKLFDEMNSDLVGQAKKLLYHQQQNNEQVNTFGGIIYFAVDGITVNVHAVTNFLS